MVAVMSKGPLLVGKHELEMPTFQASCAEPSIDLEMIKCIGPGLYDYVDDGTFQQWLQEHPCSNDEAFVIRDVPSSPVKGGATKEFLIELFDDTKGLLIESPLVSNSSSSEDTMIAFHRGSNEGHLLSKSINPKDDPESTHLSFLPTNEELEKVSQPIQVINPIPIHAKGVLAKRQCQYCVSPREIERCKSSQILFLPIDCHQPKDWDVSLALTIGQSSTAIRELRNNRVL